MINISPQIQQYVVLAIIAIVFAIIAYRLVKKLLHPTKDCTDDNCCGCKLKDSCTDIKDKKH